MEEENYYQIKEVHLRNILEQLSTLRYADVHWVMLILENLDPQPKVVDQQPELF